MPIRFTVGLFIAALLFAAAPVSSFARSTDLGVIGKLIAVERVDERDCDDLNDDGGCSYEAIKRALENLQEYMAHFHCVGASRRSAVLLSPAYEKMSRHDSGPVVRVEGQDLRCDIDPRSELTLVDLDGMGEECSKLLWKCNVVWLPDYDQTIALIGRLPE